MVVHDDGSTTKMRMDGISENPHTVKIAYYTYTYIYTYIYIDTLLIHTITRPLAKQPQAA